jgi:Rieske 2Fe-2S family protein
MVGPLSADELAQTRRPVDSAQLLPPRVFHDPSIFDFEQRNWFARTWLCVAREGDVAEPGSYILVGIGNESVIVVRDRMGTLNAFNNVCRHRGSTILDPATDGAAGRVVRFQCPYHAWTYDLDGALQRAPHTERLVDFEDADNGLVPVALDTWAGFVFINLDPDAGALSDYLADLPAAVTDYPIGSLRRARRIEYEVGSNWKFIGENYSECYHCPGLHPQLNKLTPVRPGRRLRVARALGGRLDGAGRRRRDDGPRRRPPQWPAALAGITPIDERRVYYYVLWPNTFISIHPTTSWSTGWCRRRRQARSCATGCSSRRRWPAPDFDASDAVDFWDLTNRQDWHVCELQQPGHEVAQLGRAGRFSNQEASVHAFDLMCADHYANDGSRTRFSPRHDKWSKNERRSAVRQAG